GQCRDRQDREREGSGEGPHGEIIKKCLTGDQRRRTTIWENTMHKMLMAVSGLALALVSTAQAQAPLKIGLILPYSGQFADTATQMDNGIKLYMKQNGDTVAGRKIEIIRKDSGGVAPDVAKRLSQELIVRDGVEILAGFVLTPNAMAASDV